MKEKQYFCYLVELERAKRPDLKEMVLKKLEALSPNNKVMSLEVDEFKLIEDWHHSILFELIDLYHGNLDISKISAQLEISNFEIKNSHERMERLELIQKNKIGLYKKVNNNIVVKSLISNKALQNYHTSMLQKASKALITQSPKKKYIGSETLSFDDSSLVEFNEITENYFQQVLKLAEKSNKKNHIYHLGIQFFQLYSKKESDHELHSS